MSKGVVYILTNPSFPEYVKIGYAAESWPSKLAGKGGNSSFYSIGVGKGE